ncbi:MAG: ATPase [Kiritimatiellae bacterium]|nr:ATPase [Kiritimatiellia bacterium]
MAEELQHLIERIRADAIERAEAEAARILAQAREKAAAEVREAERRAREILEKAERDAAVFAERAKRTLEQAARDLLIAVGQGIENILHDIVSDAVDRALDIATLQQMMLKIAQAYCQRQGEESRVEFLISEQDQQQIIAFFADQYRQKLVQGITIRAESGLRGGFRVALKDGHVYHDFTKPAIAEALSRFLRPHLAEIVHRAAEEPAESAESTTGGGARA